MSSLPRDPLTGTDRLLVDGTNLLHAMSRRPGPAPAAALVGRLRGAIPATIEIELVFDGMPEHGMRGERVASGVRVRHAGRRSADELLVSLVDEMRATAGPQATGALLVISDDHGLRASLRARGARTAGSRWLLDRLDRPRLSSPSVGNRRAPGGAGSGSGTGGSSRSGASRDTGRDGSGAGRGTGRDGSGGGGHSTPRPSGDEADPSRPGWKPGRGATTKRGNPRRGRPPSGRISP